MTNAGRTNTLGKYLRMLRKDKGVKQDAVAYAIKVTRATYSHYENGRIIPPTEVLVQLSSYFDVELETLIDLAVEDKKGSSREEKSYESAMDAEEIMFYYRKMPEDDKQLIKAIVKEFYLKKVKK
ncbi:MAG: helix-turn-helix domain-containing protein [Butyrivibrio sp.]|nr:helix-turn-helix domain-containing protein [Butyrivibrio sp.]